MMKDEKTTDCCVSYDLSSKTFHVTPTLEPIDVQKVIGALGDLFSEVLRLANREFHSLDGQGCHCELPDPYVICNINHFELCRLNFTPTRKPTNVTIVFICGGKARLFGVKKTEYAFEPHLYGDFVTELERSKWSAPSLKFDRNVMDEALRILSLRDGILKHVKSYVEQYEENLLADQRRQQEKYQEIILGNDREEDDTGYSWWGTWPGKIVAILIYLTIWSAGIIGCAYVAKASWDIFR